jgi:asparagine synthase (glutamine-hydrolysing)
LEDISKKLFGELKETCDSCKGDLISLSGGLDSTILAYFLKEKKPKAITIISKDFAASDLTYCQIASKEFELPLTIISVETTEILEAIKETISILKNFNDIEIRNNLVMYLAIKWAKDHGFNRIITGDGADELFAGYSFLVKKPEDQIEKEIKRISSIMHFPTQKIGEFLGVTVESPFLDEKIIELANNIPANLKIKIEKNRKYGKWILRKTFEKKIPPQIVWRDKSPMQDGSGTRELTNLFDSIISDEVFSEKKKKIEQDYHITIRSKESLHYFEIYKNLFGLSQDILEDAISCPFCHFNTENSKFCRMCGAYPI